MSTAAHGRQEAASVLRVTIAQLNLVVGAVDGNLARLEAAIRAGRAAHADVVLTPELGISGYPPEDLLASGGFVAACALGAAKLAEATDTATAAIVGAPLAAEPSRTVDSRERGLHNAALVLGSGRVLGAQAKRLLPDYDVFDETRWFAPGPTVAPLWHFGGRRVGLLVCEDLWGGELAEQAVERGAEVLFVINASPWDRHKGRQRSELVCSTVERVGVPLVYVNLVGAQDGVVFDGASCVAVPGEGIIWRAPAFEEVVETVAVPIVRRGAVSRGTVNRGAVNGALGPAPGSTSAASGTSSEAELWGALRLGLGDYFAKNGFERVWIGLSGGIDSALVATLAVDALGAEAVTGVLMPSNFSSEGSVNDALELAARLGIATHTLRIDDPVLAIRRVLHGDDYRPGPFACTKDGVAEENIQARIRGLYLMALSNKFGGVVLSTGNRSELAVGYCTLYGDMSGGFSPLADVPKTTVYALARWRNEPGAGVNGMVPAPIPESSITKAPSAELAPSQLDANSLPPYPLLDWILERSIDEHSGPEAIAEELAEGARLGCPPGSRHGLLEEAASEGALEGLDGAGAGALVGHILELVDRAEYKRRQGAPLVRVSRHAWGRDRRMPITHHWHPRVS